MASVPRAIEKAAPAGTPAEKFIARKFDVNAVRGLSKHALEVHLALYETYVKEANSVHGELYAPVKGTEPSLGEQLSRDGLVRRYAFERNGVLLHELYFEALDGSDAPPATSGVFMEAVDASFGGFDQWKKDVARLAKTRGVGWVLTFQSPDDNQLVNLWVDDHTRGHIPGLKPVLAIDFWEHAYLLDFKPSERPKYLQTLFDNINWEVVEARCRSSTQAESADIV